MGKGHPTHQRIISHEEIIKLWKTPKTIRIPLQDLTDLSKMTTPDSDKNLRREEKLESEMGDFTLNLRISKEDPSDASVILMLHEGGNSDEEDNRILARIDICKNKTHHAKTLDGLEEYAIKGPHIHILVEQEQDEQGDAWFAFGFPITKLDMAIAFAAYFFNIEYVPDNEGRKNGTGPDEEHDRSTHRNGTAGGA